MPGDRTCNPQLSVCCDRMTGGSGKTRSAHGACPCLRLICMVQGYERLCRYFAYLAHSVAFFALRIGRTFPELASLLGEFRRWLGVPVCFFNLDQLPVHDLEGPAGLGWLPVLLSQRILKQLFGISFIFAELAGPYPKKQTANPPVFTISICTSCQKSPLSVKLSNFHHPTLLANEREDHAGSFPLFFSQRNNFSGLL
jgi:hypothetical protein